MDSQILRNPGFNISFNLADAMTQLNKRNGSVVDPRIQAQATTGIMFALGFYTLCGCIIILLFSLLRPHFQSTYSPKMRLKVCRPPPLPVSLFGWINTVYALEESYILNNVGLDAVMLLRFYKFGMYVFGILSFVGLLVIAPVNYVGGRNVKIFQVDELNNTISDEIIMLRSLSIENIPNQSPLIKVHFAFCYVISFIMFLMVARFYHSWVQIRMHFCRKLIRLQHKRVETRSVLVTGIPQSLRSEEKLLNYFRELNLGKIESVVMGRLWTRLQHALAKRTHYLLHLESLCTDMVGNPIKYLPRQSARASEPPHDSSATLLSEESDSSESRHDQLNEGAASVDPVDHSFNDLAPPANTSKLSKKEIEQLQVDDSLSDDYEEGAEENEAGSGHLPFDAGSEEVTEEEKLYYENMYSQLEVYLKKFAYKTTHIAPLQKSLEQTPLSSSGLLRGPILQKAFAGFVKWDVRVRRLRSSRISSPPTTMAFVTFDHPRTAVEIARSVVSPREFMMLTRLAPEPRDIFWPNIASPVASPVIKLVRNALAKAALVAIAFAWLAPVSFFAGLLSLDKLQGLIPGLGGVVNDMHPWVSSFLQNVLPTSALALWLGILPLVLQYLTYFQGIEAVSWIEMDIFEKYFFYQIFNVVIIMTVAGTVFSSIEQYMQSNFTTVVAALGSSFATISPFFINYTLLQAMVLGPLELLMPAAILWRLFRRLLPYCKTPRDWASTCTTKKSTLHYGIVYATPILVFTVGLTYSTIQPLILPFSTLYYGLNYLVLKYRFVYVHFPRYETGGKFTPMVVKRLMFGIGFYQVVLAGILCLKGFYLIALPSLIPLLVVTWYVNRLLRDGCEVLAETCPLRVIADELESDDSTDLIDGELSGATSAALKAASDSEGTGGSNVSGNERNTNVESKGAPAPVEANAGSLRRRLLRGMSFAVRGEERFLPRTRAPKPRPLFAEKFKRFECDDKTDYKESTMDRFNGILDVSVDSMHAYISEMDYNKQAEQEPLSTIDFLVNLEYHRGEEDDLQMRSYLHPAIVGKLPQLWLPKPRF